MTLYSVTLPTNLSVLDISSYRSFNPSIFAGDICVSLLTSLVSWGILEHDNNSRTYIETSKRRGVNGGCRNPGQSLYCRSWRKGISCLAYPGQYTVRRQEHADIPSLSCNLEIEMKMQPENVILVYSCYICNHTAEQSADSLVESGTAVCPDCDVDMLLDSVRVDTEPVFSATLTAISNSIGDGRQWALRFVDHATGTQVTGKISGGESNIYSILRKWNPALNDWDRSIQFLTQQLKTRAFNQLTKSWKYAGCTSEELVAYIQKNLKKTPESA